MKRESNAHLGVQRSLQSAPLRWYDTFEMDFSHLTGSCNCWPCSHVACPESWCPALSHREYPWYQTGGHDLTPSEENQPFQKYRSSTWRLQAQLHGWRALSELCLPSKRLARVSCSWLLKWECLVMRQGSQKGNGWLSGSGQFRRWLCFIQVSTSPH